MRNFIDTVVIDEIKHINDYNFFCINLLQKYIYTEYCLIIQPDGFVVNPTSWSDTFLNYDYVGAPWDTTHSAAALNNCGMLNLFKNRPVPKIVGNGGFSLRSIKFLKDSAKLERKDYSIPEDNFLCVLNRNTLTEKQNKFAPVSVARTFAIEHILDENSLIQKPFGFHGRLKHLTNYISLL